MTSAVLLVDSEKADAAATRLLRLASGTQDAAAVLGAASVPGWSGISAEAAESARSEVARRAGRIGDLAVRAAMAVASYTATARRVEDARRAQDRTESRLIAERTAALAAGLPTDELDHRAAVLARARDAADEELTEAAHRAARTLAGLRFEVADRPRDALDHVGDAGRAFWGGMVTEPVSAVRGLVGQVGDDPVAGLVGAWRSSVSGVADAVTDPLRTTKQLVGWDAFAAGHWGEGAGILAASAAGLPKRLLTKAAWLPGYPDGPLPRRQNVDEMLTGVRLAQHEHLHLGHVITRHVVEIDDLKARLWSGTLQRNGVRTSSPDVASTWTDVATAEREITRILRANEAELRAFAADGRDSLQLTDSAVPASAGTVLRASHPEDVGVGDAGLFVVQSPQGGVVRLAKSPAGEVFIMTAFPTVR